LWRITGLFRDSGMRSLHCNNFAQRIETARGVSRKKCGKRPAIRH
jgi:hypothetical protein